MSRQSDKLISPAQCRMARAGLALSVRELARLAGTSGLTVSRFENGNTSCPDDVVHMFRIVLEDLGAEFTTGPQGRVGVRIPGRPADEKRK